MFILKKSKILKEIILTIASLIVLVSLIVSGVFFSQKKTYEWYIEALNMSEIIEQYSGKEVTIGILDTGLSDFMQEKLKDKIYKPYNVLSRNKNITDTIGHGTKVTSIICSEEVGIAKSAKVIPVVICDSSGRTNSNYLAEGIRYATSKGANIINISMGSFIYNEDVKKSVEEAVQKGVIIVAAAGDYNEERILYPARYDNVISVVAQSKLKRLYKNANYSNDVDACIPGEDIEVISLDGKEIMEGSSIATALYTSIIALYFEKYREIKSYNEIYEYLDSINFDTNQFINIKNLFEM